MIVNCCILQPSQNWAVCVQPLATCTDETGARRTIGDLCALAAGAIDSWRIVILGVEVHADTPAAWLAVHLSCADNFLYVSLLPK